MKYPKAFDDYWKNTHRDMGNLEYWQCFRLKVIAYRAWRKGRQHQAALKEQT